MLSMLIKPVSGICNMRCRYCFYSDVSEHREVASYGIMSDETTEALIKRTFEYAQGPVSFAFQGGEPTMAGVEYYQKFIDLTNQYNTNNYKVSYSIQTNGYDLPDELLELMREYNFLVGLSLDGTEKLHDASRIDATGNGTYKKVTDTLKRLQRNRIAYNILTVITAQNAKHVAEIYKFLRSRNVSCIQFIKHIDGFDKVSGGAPWSLSPDRYLAFLRTAFRLYYDDIMAGHYCSVREFDNFVLLASGRPAECCGMNGYCPTNMVIEADGSVYPCDFYVLDEWKMGNVKRDTIESLFQSEPAVTFRKKSYNIHTGCSSCEWFKLCKGGCMRYREPLADEDNDLYKYCESYRAFFAESYTKIYKLANMLNSGYFYSKKENKDR